MIEIISTGSSPQNSYNESTYIINYPLNNTNLKMSFWNVLDLKFLLVADFIIWDGDRGLVVISIVESELNMN
jgi:hypothetical protein